MTLLEQKSIMSILESFRNLSPFSAAKFFLLHKEQQKVRCAQKNIMESLSTMQTEVEKSVKRTYHTDGCLDPKLEYKTVSPSKNFQSFNNTFQTSLGTMHNANWYSNTSAGDISSSGLSEEKSVSYKQSNEHTLFASNHCDEINDRDNKIKRERAVNAAKEHSTFYQERKEDNGNNNKVSRSSYCKDQVELVNPERKNIIDNRTISTTSSKNTLAMDFEKDLDCKTKPSNILSQREGESGGTVNQVEEDHSYNGLQVSFKDSVEVLVSVAEEHESDESTPSLINNIADSFLRSTSQAANDNVFKTSFSCTELKKKRRSAILQCEEIGCSYKARSRGELQQHRRKHTGERPISCEWKSCGKNFKDKSTYRVHYKSVHLKRRDYKCLVPGCEKTFGCAKSRNRHSTNLNLHQIPIISLPETQPLK